MLKQGILYKTLFVTLCLVFFLSLDANAQRRGRVFRFQNILEHDLRPYHFGFTLGLNTLGFAVKPATDLRNLSFHGQDSLKYVLPQYDYGFHVGIVSNLKLNQYFDLRFIPTFAFGDRYIDYYDGEFEDGHNDRQLMDPYLLDFPLHIKYKSARMTNTRVYVIGGVKYSYDLRSFEGRRPGDDELFIRTRQHDWHYELGVGFDHYFYYFKFSTEIKASFGLRNLVLPGEEASRYYDSIDRLNSRSIMISFLFE